MPTVRRIGKELLAPGRLLSDDVPTSSSSSSHTHFGARALTGSGARPGVMASWRHHDDEETKQTNKKIKKMKKKKRPEENRCESIRNEISLTLFIMLVDAMTPQ
jgi:hypothetical protein